VKVVFICSSIGTTRGGIETTVLSLARALSDRHDVHVLGGRSLGHPALNSELGIPIIWLPILPRHGVVSSAASLVAGGLAPYGVESASLYGGFQLSKNAKRTISESDVVSVHTKYDSVLFSRWASRRGVPSVFHIQGSKFGALFGKYDRSSRYVAVSENSRKILTERFHLPIERTVTPGIPEEFLSTTREEENFLLFVGRLQQSKGTSLLLQVFTALLRRFPTLELVVAGEGPERSTMEATARSMHLESSTRFLGSISHRDLLKFYSGALALIFPSESEVFPLVPLEAMAAGCPVVASKIPGVMESTGGNAIYPDSWDAIDWTSTLAELIRNPPEREKLSVGGRRWAVKRTWKEVAISYEAELSRAVENGART